MEPKNKEITALERINTRSNNTEGYIETDLGVLPDEWDVVELKDVCFKTKNIDPRKSPNNNFKYVDVSSVCRDSLKIREYNDIVGSEAPSRARKLIKTQDVIFATVRPSLKRIALVTSEFDGEVCSTAFCVLQANQNLIDPKFLFFAVMCDDFVDKVASHQRGSSYPAVSNKDIMGGKIPLPPVKEQKKISITLSTLQRTIEKTDTVIEATKSLKKSIMKYLFTYGPVSVVGAENVVLQESEIGFVPDDWEVKDLVNVATLQRGKDLPKKNMVKGSYPVIGSGGIIGYHNKLICNGPGVITGRSGSIGNLTYVEEDYWPHNTGLYVKNFHNNNPKFIYYLLNLLNFKKYATGVSVPTLNRNFVHSLLMPSPKLSIQNEIASMLSTVDQKIEAEQNKKDTLQKLFKTLLDNLMTSKIRVNDLEV